MNAKLIAAFAGGNARVALALAHTVESHESVASLKDTELFERLFRQRHESSSSLLLSAQACSLAYSFHGEDVDTEGEAELSKLAAVVGKDARTLYADVSELKDRDLVQQRGVWRALLPHAIANRLAALTLERIPPRDFDQLVNVASARLLKSIARRLGYLHTSLAAQGAVKRWFANDALLGRVELLNETGIVMLTNVAPVDPVGTIDAIEQAMERRCKEGKTPVGEEFRTLLLSLAFEAKLFERCVALILELIENEEPGRFANQVRNSFPSLFRLMLSGTHATIEQRCRVVDGLLRSTSEIRRELGFKCVEAMLQTNGFSSFHSFEFGGRPRDYGWRPKRRSDVVHWFQSVLALCTSYDSANNVVSSRIRTILGPCLRTLWTQAKLHDEVTTICSEFQARRFWPEGWTGIRSIRRWREEPFPADEDTALTSIEASLSPKTLAEQVRAKVLRNMQDAYSDIGYRDFEVQHARHEQQLIQLGTALAGETALLEELLDELTCCSTGLTLGPTAKGLVDGTQDHRALWDKLTLSFHSSDVKQRSTELLGSYLYNLQSINPDLVEEILAEVLSDPWLSEWFPVLQRQVKISAQGIERLKQSLQRRDIPADRYRGIGWNNRLEDSVFLELVPMLLQLTGGFEVVIDALHMRIYQELREHQALSPELIAAGRTAVEACVFDQRHNHDIHLHALEEVIEACLRSEAAIPTIEKVLDRLESACADYTVGFTEENQVIGSLFAAQPIPVLNRLFGDEEQEKRTGMRDFFYHDDLLGSPLDRIPSDVLLAWCDEKSSVRYPRIAEALVPFTKSRNSDVPEWKPSALVLLEHAPNRAEVLKRYTSKFKPHSWSGSEAGTWKANAKLLDQFVEHADVELAAFAKSQLESSTRLIAELEQEETRAERRDNERFE